MRQSRLSTKLIWAMIILSSVIVMICSIAIGGGIYVLTERSIKKELIGNVNTIILDYLKVENDQVLQKESIDQPSLASYLRNLDVSALIVDTEQNTLARYGVYRDLGSEWMKILSVNTGKYEDKYIEGYGLFDFYTVPVKNEGKIYGYLQVARKNNEIEMITRAMKMVIIIILPASIVLAMLMAYWIGKRVVLPINRLSEKLESMESQSLALITPSPKMDYEVWVVVRAINKLIERLRANLERERQLSENISHEFKTPLTRIASNIQVGKLKDAEAEVIELGGNVDALLTLAVWEKTNHTCDLAKVLPAVMKQLRITDIVKLTLPKKLLTPLPSTHAQIIFRNVLDNARKNTLGDSKILIEALEENNYWVVKITNDADGTKLDPQSVVQRKYKYGKRAGQGIGMSIVDQMCKLHSIDLRINLQDNCFQVSFRGVKRIT